MFLLRVNGFTVNVCVCGGGEIGQKANSKGFSFCLKAGAGVETGISQLWDHFTTV